MVSYGIAFCYLYIDLKVQLCLLETCKIMVQLQALLCTLLTFCRCHFRDRILRNRPIVKASVSGIC
jgi:hypothetical protein